MNLTTFLIARLDEEERFATAAGHGCGHVHGHNAGWVEVEFPATHNARPVYDLRFIERFNPRRVLAEVRAKREIISTAWDLEERIEDEWGSSYSQQQMEERGQYPDILRALALIYVNHPDFNPDWA